MVSFLKCVPWSDMSILGTFNAVSHSSRASSVLAAFAASNENNQQYEEKSS